MLKRIIIAALWLPLAALAQSYPSPTFNNVTVQGTLTVSGGNAIGLGALAQQAANTVLANATGSTANVTAFSMPSCSTSASALNWTSGTGFTCNSAINAAQLGGNASSFYATSGANSNITSLSGLTTPLSVAQGGVGASTLAAHGVILGQGTSSVTTVVPVSAGFVLTDNGPGSNPSFQAATTGRLLNVQVFTSSGTYTPTTGTNSVIVEIQGAGGAGGGGPATAAGQVSAGAGGSAGGYIKHRMTSGFSGATVTIGSGGIGSAGANGGAGGNTSFAGITASGGPGGVINGPGSSININNSSQGGSASGGSILNIAGAVGSPSVVSTSGFPIIAGVGASSPLGSGGVGANGATGGVAKGFGAGGGGANQTTASSAAVTGGSGSGGIVIIYEYN